MLRYQHTLITPTLAKKFLDKNIVNRTVKKGRVAMICRDILADRYAEQPNPISISTEDQLLDGQHRLMAIIMADRAVYMTVCYGVVKNDVFWHIDENCSRKTTDILKMSGEKDYSTLSATMTHIYFYAYGEQNRNARKVSNEEKKNILDRVPAVREAVSLGRNIRIVPPSVSSFMYFLGNHGGDPESTAAFMEALKMGDALLQDSPAFILREYALRRNNNLRGASVMLLRAGIYSLDAFLTGRPVTKNGVISAARRVQELSDCPPEKVRNLIEGASITELIAAI